MLLYPNDDDDDDDDEDDDNDDYDEVDENSGVGLNGEEQRESRSLGPCLQSY